MKSASMQNSNLLREELAGRLLQFAVDIIKLTGTLTKTYAERHIGQQLVRCGTSPGANYQEACAAESRADFVHKMQIVLKELRESVFWLKILHKACLGNMTQVKPLLNEAMEHSNIIGKSVATAKSKLGKRR